MAKGEFVGLGWEAACVEGVLPGTTEPPEVRRNHCNGAQPEATNQTVAS